MQQPQPGGREFNIGRAAMQYAAGAVTPIDEWGNDRGVGQFAVGASPGVTSTATYLTASSIK